MNKCITCGKVVTKPTAENLIQEDTHTYLVCCPLCEKEFHRDPDHYLAVAQSLFGNCDMNAFSTARQENNSPALSFDNIRMLQKLKDNFAEIERFNIDLNRHLTLISSSRGLEGLRKALRDHREMMDSLSDKISVHAGMCRYVSAMAESTMAITSRAVGE